MIVYFFYYVMFLEVFHWWQGPPIPIFMEIHICIETQERQ